MRKIVIFAVCFLMSVVAVCGLTQGAFAAKCAGAETSLISCGEDKDGVEYLLALVINVLSGLVGALAVLGMVFSGYQYMTSAGDPSKMAKAKSRIVQIVIGLIVLAVMWAVLNWLVPGGIFNS